MSKIHPLDTTEQRLTYHKGVWRTQMSRGECAAIIQLLATDASQLEKPLLIADAATVVENAESAHFCDDYYPGDAENYDDDDENWACPFCAEYSVYSELLQGFDQPDLTVEEARELLERVARTSSAGIFYDTPHQFGAALAVLINPAWKTDIRARLELFRLLDIEKKQS